MTLLKSTGILSRMARTGHVFFSSTPSTSSPEITAALKLCGHHSDPKIREKYALAIVNMINQHPGLSAAEAYNKIQGERDMHFTLYAKPITNDGPSNAPGCKK